METQLTELELIHKLVLQSHLNVPERRALPNGRARASLMLDAMEALLQRDGWFPGGARPEDDFSGPLIELTKEGRCQIYWKFETSFLRYQLGAVHEYPTARAAAEVYLRDSFGDSIDGIPIDWSS